MIFQTTIYMRKDDLDQAVDRLLCLSEKYRPNSFSLGEGEERRSISEYDFWTPAELHAELVTFSVNSGIGDDISISSFVNMSAYEASILADQTFSLLPFYGFACAYDERIKKNQNVEYVEGKKVTSWYGRNYRLYVPSIYWKNIFSREYLELMGIKIADLFDLTEFFSCHQEAELLTLTAKGGPGWWHSNKQPILGRLPVFDIDVVREEIVSGDQTLQGLLSNPRLYP